MTDHPSCTECNRPLEEGFLLDHVHGGHAAGHWVAGEAERSVWTGIKLRGRRQVPVRAMRCPDCGILRLYAREV